MVDRPEGPGPGTDRAADLYEARIFGTADELDRLLRSVPLDVGCSHPHFGRHDDGSFILFAYATMEQAGQLRHLGHRIEVGENMSERARRRQSEIGKGDRFQGGKIAPRGLGRKPGRGGQKWTS